MKKMLIGLLAVGLFSAMPVLAAEHGMKMESKGSMKMETKDGIRECMLVSESIQDKIKRFEAEVAKGDKKADPKEMKKLKRKLDEANKMLNLMYGP